MIPGFPQPLAMSAKVPKLAAYKVTRTSTPSTSFALNAPDNVKAGDVLVAFLHRGSGSTALNPPSAWTISNASPANPSANLLAWKIAGASEPTSYTFTIGTTGGNVVAVIAAFRGGQGAFDVGGAFQKVSSDTSVAPSISPTAKGLLLGFFAQSINTSVVVTPPAGMDEVFVDTGGNPRLAMYTQRADPGPTGTRTLVWSVSNNVTSILAQVI